MSELDPKIKEAQEALSQGKSAETTQICEALLASDPNNAEAWHLKGVRTVYGHLRRYSIRAPPRKGAARSPVMVCGRVHGVVASATAA